MKRFFLLFLVLIFMFLIAGCSNTSDSNGISTEPIEMEQAKTERTFSDIEILVKHNWEEREPASLSEDEVKTVCEILDSIEWGIEMPACDTDYTFHFGDRKILYHSDCGTFIEPGGDTGGKYLSLNENEMNTINDILTGYFES